MVRDRTPLGRERFSLVRDRNPLVQDRTPLVRNRNPLLRDKTPLFCDRTPLFRDRTPVIREMIPLVRDDTPIFGSFYPTDNPDIGLGSSQRLRSLIVAVNQHILYVFYGYCQLSGQGESEIVTLCNSLL